MHIPGRPPVVGLEETVGQHLAILRALPDLIFVLDAQDVFIDAYAGDESAFIVAPHQFIGRHVRDVLPDLADDTTRLCRLAREGGGIQTLEYNIELAGDPRSFEARLSAFGEGHIAVVSRDVTARRRAEAELRRAEAEERHVREEQRRLQTRIEQAQRLESLGLLAGGVAHDFNNLLTSMIGYADLVKKAVPEGTDVHRMVAEIEEAAECAIGLTRQMLAYAGRGQSVIETVAIDDLVRDMTRLLGTAARPDARLVLDLAPASLVGDASQIRQVLMNLITNASEAIHEGGDIRVATGVRYVEREELRSPYLHEELPAGDYAWIEVRDSGCGMSPTTVARIFDPFFSTKFTGRGLGLAAVLGIVRGHGGTIQVTSVEGRGSRFLVLLPHRSEPIETKAPIADALPDVRGAGTVLVIEDDPSVRSYVQRVLEGAGFEAVTAADGIDGLARFRRLRAPVAVVVDFMMPHFKGDEVAGEIRKLDPAVPVILMSGFSEIDVMNRAVNTAATHFIQKPFRAVELIRTLQSAISLNQTR